MGRILSCKTSYLGSPRFTVCGGCGCALMCMCAHTDILERDYVHAEAITQDKVWIFRTHPSFFFFFKAVLLTGLDA